MAHHSRSSSLAVALVAVAGCYASAPPQAPVPIAAAAARSSTPIVSPVRNADAELVADLCPLRVPGSTVTPQAVEQGAALVFVTSGDVADVRRRVRAMADLHDHNRDVIARTVRARRMLHAADRYVEDVPGGARIVFNPGNTMDPVAYQQEVGFEAMRLRAGDCPVIMPERLSSEGSQIATR